MHTKTRPFAESCTDGRQGSKCPAGAGKLVSGGHEHTALPLNDVIENPWPSRFATRVVVVVHPPAPKLVRVITNGCLFSKAETAQL
jgi:hypothetical protein